jgi:hypothetical protein
MATTVKYGVSAEITRDFGDMTVGELVADQSILAALGAPEGVSAVSSGETLGNNEKVSDYPTIQLEKRASSKAKN